MRRDWDKLRRYDKARRDTDPIASFRPHYSREFLRKIGRKRAQLLFERLRKHP